MPDEIIVIFLSQKKDIVEKSELQQDSLYFGWRCLEADRDHTGLQKINCHLVEVGQQGFSHQWG